MLPTVTFPHSWEGGVSSQGWTDGGQWRGVKIYMNSLRLHFHSALEKEAHLRVSFAPSAESSSLPGDSKKARKKGAACGPLRPFPTPLRRFPYKGPRDVAPEARQPDSGLSEGPRNRGAALPTHERRCPSALSPGSHLLSGWKGGSKTKRRGHSYHSHSATPSKPCNSLNNPVLLLTHTICQWRNLRLWKSHV